MDWLKEYVDLEGLSPTEISDAFTQIGLMLDKPFDGRVFDLEHRFDRSDWLSILGCARDLSAYLGRDLKLPQTYTKEGKKPTSNQLVDIKVECSDVVNRFNTVVFRNIKVKPSPVWLKNRLEEYGIPSINNIVDITNYVMVELGQPMHAQDLAKFRKQEVVIRKARNEERLCTFLGDEVTLYPEAFVLTQYGVATVLGGIVGGRETGVDKNTTDIILDAGNYNQNIIRKVSRKLKIQNETVLRYDKFLHPNLTQYAIERATYLILELAGGEYYQNVDWNPKQSQPKEMVLRSSRLRTLAGFEIEKDMAVDILTRLGYEVVYDHNSQSIRQTKISSEKDVSEWEQKLIVPYFRTDIEVEDDIVSDILRINGYTKIPTAQIQSAPPKEITSEIYKFEETLRDALVQLGAHEHITDPLVSSILSRDKKSAGNQIVLENSQNSQKNALRLSIADTLENIVPNYIKNQIPSGVLFEVGKVYTQQGDKKDYATYKEVRVLECLVFDKEKSPKELHKQTSSILGGLFKILGMRDISITKVRPQEAQIKHNDKVLGTIRYNGFTLFTEVLLTAHRQTQRIVADILDRRSVDVSLLIPKDLSVGKVIDFVAKSNEIAKVEFLEEYVDDHLDKNLRSVLIKIFPQTNLTQEQANASINRTLTNLKTTLDARIRS